MMQHSWFTLIFCVLPLGIAAICKYWLMKDIWDTDQPSRLGAFISYYVAASLMFWTAVLTLRDNGVID